MEVFRFLFPALGLQVFVRSVISCVSCLFLRDSGACVAIMNREAAFCAILGNPEQPKTCAQQPQIGMQLPKTCAQTTAFFFNPIFKLCCVGSSGAAPI